MKRATFQRLCDPFAIGIFVVFSLATVDAAWAQAPTTVQLPTFQQFTIGTTVSVPDGGSALLGGVNSHQAGVSSQGIPMLGRLPGLGRAFNNRAMGLNSVSNQARVKATIIDLQEMDAALRGQAAALRVREQMLGTAFGNDGGVFGGAVGQATVAEEEVNRRARFLSQNVGKSAWQQGSTQTARKATTERPTHKRLPTKSTATRAPEPPLKLKGTTRK